MRAQECLLAVRPRDWATATLHAEMAMMIRDRRRVVRAYLDHLSTPELIQVFSDKNTNGPMLPSS
jgi:hypothetical protein